MASSRRLSSFNLFLKHCYAQVVIASTLMGAAAVYSDMTRYKEAQARSAATWFRPQTDSESMTWKVQ